MTKEVIAQIATMAGLLTVFTGVVLWSVKAQLSNFYTSMTQHIDEKLRNAADDLRDLTKKTEKHQQDIAAHKLAMMEAKNEQLQLKNEMLEKMSNTYVRREDIESIKSQIQAIFERLDKVIFKGDAK